jgi:hypothetical protein
VLLQVQHGCRVPVQQVLWCLGQCCSLGHAQTEPIELEEGSRYGGYAAARVGSPGYDGCGFNRLAWFLPACSIVRPHLRLCTVTLVA